MFHPELVMVLRKLGKLCSSITILWLKMVNLNKDVVNSMLSGCGIISENKSWEDLNRILKFKEKFVTMKN